MGTPFTATGRVPVRLRPLKDWHLVTRIRFCKDPELARLMGVRDLDPTLTVPDLREWRDQRVAAGDVLLGIEAGDRYIGDIDIAFPSHRQAAELTLMIGERRFWGKGIGTEVVRRVLGWLFRGDELVIETSTAPSGMWGKDPPPAPLGPVPGGLVDYIEVDVAPGNERARGFWLTQGFTRYSWEPGGTEYLRLYRQEWLEPAGGTAARPLKGV